MLQEVEETTPTVRKLKINIPSSVIEEEIASAYNRLKATAKIPGFRVGKVPQGILEKKFSKDIGNQVIEKIVPEFYSRAIKEANIWPITFPKIEGTLDLVKNQPLSFTATVEVKPEVKNLNYEGIVLKKKPFSVDEDEIKAAISALQGNRAFLKTAEMPVKKGDVAIINSHAFIDNKEIKDLTFKDYPFVIGSNVFPEKFSDALLHKKKGDKFDITVTFDTTHQNKNIAGKEVLFNVSISELKEKVLPQLDNEFAKGFNCSSIEELKKKIYDNIYKSKQKQINNEYQKEIMDQLIHDQDFEVPDSMTNKELEFQLYEAKQNALSKGDPIQSDEDLIKKYRTTARNNVKGLIVLEAIGKKENIEVSDDEVKQAINEIAVQHGLKPEEVTKLYITKDGSLDVLRSRLYGDKVLNLVLSKAVIKKTL